jgi:hypothetical protein
VVGTATRTVAKRCTVAVTLSTALLPGPAALAPQGSSIASSIAAAPAHRALIQPIAVPP